jgi:asparagine synthase (glutamine-hydrolysing)
MSAIAGIVDPHGGIDPAVLAAMTATLAHRGPDDESYHLTEPAPGVPAIGLGFRRLSIIDVDGGRQPLCSEDGAVWLVFDGEVYNFRELRAGLEARGHNFRTGGDAEVIVHLYEERGLDCLERVNGMFALALWDSRSRVLFAARDRMGEKPLYWTERAGRLLFASELKALRQHPSCPTELDHEALERYLAHEYVPSPRSIVAGVSKLPAGHRLVWERGRTSVERYWDVPASPVATHPDDELAGELRAHLSEAVRLRLAGDVPLGAFLSGGIDSSSVVALMFEHLLAGQVKTFSIGFEEPSFDESEHALAVARHFGTDHHEEVFAARTVLDVLPELAGQLDEPFADPSILPTYLLSRFARRSVTVALGGDGSDELLAGYPTFAAEAAAARYPVPRTLHERVVAPLVEWLPISKQDFGVDLELERFLRGVHASPAVRHQLWLGAFSPAEQAALLAGPLGCDPYADAAALHDDPSRARPLERLLYLYAKTCLADGILVKTDRASMLASLAVRAPFLDHTLVEFLARVPSHLKLRRRKTKVLLKRAVTGLLPPGIADRPTQGIRIPVAAWLKAELREPMLDLLSAERLRGQGLFEPREAERLVREHLSGRRDHRKQLWTLLMFQLWLESVSAPRVRELPSVPTPIAPAPIAA